MTATARGDRVDMNEILEDKQLAAPIVVGVDGSASSLAALRRADRIARALNVPLEAVIAWHTPMAVGGYPVALEVSPEDDARGILNASLDTVFGEQRPAWIHSTIMEGNPAKVLIDESRHAEMLVLGSRGHGGFAGLLLGSVSAACAEHARCPVLVMHTAE